MKHFGDFSICFEHYVDCNNKNNKNNKNAQPGDKVNAKAYQDGFRLLWFVETNESGYIFNEKKVLITKHYVGGYIYLGD